VEGRQPPIDLLGQDRQVRSHPLLLGVVAAALTVAGCSAGSQDAGRSASGSTSAPATSAPAGSHAATPAPDSTGSSTGPATPAVVPPAPPISGCYRLTTDQLTEPTNDSTPVSCTGRHTAQTIEVGILDTVVDGHALAVDSAAVQQQLATRCPQALAAYVGGTADQRRLSRFNVVWYSPTLAESDRGADWFRCDLIAFAGPDELQPLPAPRRLRNVLDRPGALDDYGLCGNSAPGARGFERVLCARPHTWRAVDTITIAGGKRYPGTSRVRRAGDADCKDVAQARADDTLRFRYGWEWPTREQWARGQRYGYCWVPG
jgi:hypothetical protein